MDGMAEQLSTVARLRRGRDVIAVTDDDDLITKHYQGDASGVHAMVRAIKTFCLAAQGELGG